MATEIIIAGRSPDEGPMAETLNEAEMTDEMNYEAMSPEGNFKMNSMNALVKATNKLLPAFGEAIAKVFSAERCLSGELDEIYDNNTAD